MISSFYKCIFLASLELPRWFISSPSYINLWPFGLLEVSNSLFSFHMYWFQTLFVFDILNVALAVSAFMGLRTILSLWVQRLHYSACCFCQSSGFRVAYALKLSRKFLQYSTWCAQGKKCSHWNMRIWNPFTLTYCFQSCLTGSFCSDG